jgi:long-subunit fatty acid transport protein
LDATYGLWSAIPEFWKIDFKNNSWDQTLSQTDSTTGIRADRITIPNNNNIEFGIGFEYRKVNGMAYRLGYRFSQSPNSDDSFNMFFPQVDTHWISFGIKLKGDSYFIDATLAYAIGSRKVISQRDNPLWLGTYESDLLVPVVKLHYQL